MRFKGTLALLVAFAALGAYVYFTEFSGAEERQKQEEAKKQLFGGEAKDVTEITLEYEGRTVTAVRKDEKTWEISSPAGLEADSDVWEGMASSLVQMEKDETVSAVTDLAPFGLDKPLVAVRAKMKGADAGVLFGGENPRKSFNYAKKVDSDEVFLTTTTWGGAFKKTLTDLRNKKVLDFEAADIDLIRVSAAGKPEIELQKSGMDWMVKKPVDGRADAGEVSGFLSSIQFSRTSAFADEALDAKATGIDAPAARVVLHDAKANVDKVLVFGKSPEMDKFYAKNQAKAPVFILGTEIINKTQQPLLAWRDKSVFRLGEQGTAGVDELEMAHGADKFVVKKSGEEWKLPDGKKASEGQVFSILSELEGARATQIIDAPGALSAHGLDKPRLQITARGGGKELATISFGRDNTNPAGVQVKSAGPAVMTVPKMLYDTVNVKMSDFVETPPPAPTPTK